MVLEDIPAGSRAFSEELFGPVFSLYKVRNDDEAVALANATEYGLGASLFCSDLDRAERVARRIDAGSVFINDFCKSQNDIPSGGTKGSGYGKENYKEGFTDLSNAKSIVFAEQK